MKTGNINTIAKWDLINNCWNYNIDDTNLGKSLAIANYTPIINNEKEKINYIIIGYGSRVEDHSKDSKTIKEKEVRIDNTLNYFQKLNSNYNIKLFLMDADAPIIEDAKLLAQYIDLLASQENTNTINIIALSKCGAMSFYMPSFFKNPYSFQKTNIFNAATPYRGTKLASPLIFYPEVKQLVINMIGDHKLTDLIYKNLIKFYESISSNSHMDYDIAVPNGIPKDKLNCYDSSFIPNIFQENNINAIKRINGFKNIVTTIDDKTFREAAKTMNFTGMGLCLINKIFFENKSDGMVYCEDQKNVESVLDIHSYTITSHHSVNTNIKAFNNILDLVNDSIEEEKEKKLSLKI